MKKTISITKSFCNSLSLILYLSVHYEEGEDKNGIIRNDKFYNNCFAFGNYCITNYRT